IARRPRPPGRTERRPARARRRVTAGVRVFITVAMMPAAALADDLRDAIAHLGHHDVPHLAATAAHGFDVLSYSCRRHAVWGPPRISRLPFGWISIFAEDVAEDATDFTQSCIPAGRLEHGVHHICVSGTRPPHTVEPLACVPIVALRAHLTHVGHLSL